ncbi:hypothetical protein ACEN2J_02860 [Pseudorhodobacter sp. W20_MBD10_FR17]|uniref:hypothetical protein n=1 Tax=Pseudorhodobacter sp. W20_MBD10_FR17 TaxID=3240266 RepID=UPI003F995FEC
MFDPNFKDFNERVGRLKAVHAQGHGFDAAGVLGRAQFRRSQRKNRFRLVMPIVLVLTAVFALKGSIYYFVGAGPYETRLVALQQGEGFGKLGALLMAPDRATLWVSEVLRRSLQKRS